MKLSPNHSCPCSSGRKYKKCCRPYHLGNPAPTPEALMRSRFCAYALGDADYIMNTTHPESEHYREDRTKWRAQVEAFIINTEFVGLRVTAAQGNFVDFTATLVQEGAAFEAVEHSEFKQHDGRWLYLAAHDPAADEEAK